MVGRCDFPGISHAQNVALRLIFTRKASMSRKGIHLLLPISMSLIFPLMLSHLQTKWEKVKSKSGTSLLKFVRHIPIPSPFLNDITSSGIYLSFERGKGFRWFQILLLIALFHKFLTRIRNTWPTKPYPPFITFPFLVVFFHVIYQYPPSFADCKHL